MIHESVTLQHRLARRPLLQENRMKFVIRVPAYQTSLHPSRPLFSVCESLSIPGQKLGMHLKRTKLLGGDVRIARSSF